MLVIKLLNSSSRFLILLTFSLFFHFQAIGVESADIWKKEKKEDLKKEDLKKEDSEEKSKIDF
jgi:hypothetical protein